MRQPHLRSLWRTLGPSGLVKQTRHRELGAESEIPRSDADFGILTTGVICNGKVDQNDDDTAGHDH
jgi:hypothetical protein